MYADLQFASPQNFFIVSRTCATYPLAGGVHRGTSGGFGSRQVRFEAAPFGVGEVALICSSHARYPTERALQDPFSDSFMTEFYEVQLRVWSVVE